MNDRKELYKKIHQEIADQYSTDPEVIGYVRSRAGSGLSLIEIQDGVEKKIVNIQASIEAQRKAIEKRSDPARYTVLKKAVIQKRNAITQRYLDEALKQKGRYLGLSVFIRKLNDKKFADITRPITDN